MIELENVAYSYGGGELLSSLSLTLAPGSFHFLTGPSGAGKTTIIQLLLRFYDPSRGQITLDGDDLRDLNRADFRRHIALVPQDPVIFATSALENIRFGRPDATDAVEHNSRFFAIAIAISVRSRVWASRRENHGLRGISLASHGWS